MKKSKPDYFRIIENISKCCLSECENISSIINNRITKEINISSTDELISLTDILRKEYLTPIEREDLFSIASCLHKIDFSLKTACSDLKRRNDSSAEVSITLNSVFSTVTQIDNCIKNISANNKPEVYTCAFNAIRCAEKGLFVASDTSKDNYSKVIISLQRCLYFCRDTADRIIYIYLKNS